MAKAFAGKETAAEEKAEEKGFHHKDGKKHHGKHHLSAKFLAHEKHHGGKR